MKRLIFISSLICLIEMTATAQTKVDSTMRKNTIKLDLTSAVLYRNAFILSYERVVKPYQSWSVTFGYQQFPKLGNLAGSNIVASRDGTAYGYKLGTEYRFYLQKENKYPAPRGVYIGPYMSILTFNNARSVDVNVSGVTQTAALSTQIDIINIGAQLGYQFLLNDRWAIDIIFIGPSLSNYRANLKLDGTFTFDPDEVNNAVLEGLLDRFPGFKDLLTNREASSKGQLDIWSTGYRFQFHVGYHFGRKKSK